MPRRPSFSLPSFLSFLFRPAKNPQPSGIQKKRLKGLRGGRKRSRLTAFNAMKPANQRLLDEAGKRDAYLRGETTLGEAKRSLREKAVELGIAKPLRGGVPGARQPVVPVSRDAVLKAQIARYLKRTLTVAGKNINPLTIDRYSPGIPEWVIDDVPTWDAGQIASAAQRGSIFDVAEAGAVSNPFWYR